ncbi:SMAD/FHA domain-containing protein, partial [Mycena sp. CBHHK59/15]
FRSKTVSRCHAELWTENGDVFIRDTKSLSGTFINGTRISEANEESFEHVLADGDEVRFGAPV